MTNDSKRTPERRGANTLVVPLLSALMLFMPFSGFKPGPVVWQIGEAILAYSGPDWQFFYASQAQPEQSPAQPNPEPQIIRKIDVVVTGYSSTPEETDDTPLITAQGTKVRDGIVAANFLPFGARIKLPELYGDKTFVVEDRMHPRKTYQVDIWFPTQEQAIHFGAIATYIEVLEEPIELVRR